MRPIALLLLAGCGGSSDPTGLWLLNLALDPADHAGQTCNQDVTENFAHAAWPVEEQAESNWTETESQTSTGIAVLVRIETLEDGGAVLFFADAIFPGQEDEGGGWQFGWTDEQVSSYEQTHAEGYAYQETESATAALSWSLALADSAVTGTWAATTDSTSDWRESDGWDSDEVGLSSGQIPASAWLEDTEDVWASVENEPDSSDCDEDPCRLTVSSQCEDTIAVTGARLELDEADTIEDHQLSSSPDLLGD